MLKKTLTMAMAIFMVAAMTASAMAFTGKATAVDGKIVTIVVDGQLPPWVKEGAIAKALGGLAKVASVEGKTIGLKVKKSKAKKVEIGSTLEVKPKAADASQMLQGC